MCCVIGALSEESLISRKQKILDLFEEGKIRGLHATGVAWHDGERVKASSVAGPPSNLWPTINLEDVLQSRVLIGHCRYSTSSEGFHQPIYDGAKALVHNGVISQEEPSQWHRQWNYDYKTKNDSEILFHTMSHLGDPSSLSEASLAFLFMTEDASVVFGRNGERPLWRVFVDGVLYIASTANILIRALGSVAPIPCPAGMLFRFSKGSLSSRFFTTKKDLQEKCHV